MMKDREEEAAALAAGYNHADEAYRLLRMAEEQLGMAARTCPMVANEICGERALCQRLADDLGKRLDNLADHSA